MVAVSPQAAGPTISSGSIETFIDVLHEELELHYNVGRNQMDVITYREYEHRKDRRAEALKYEQLWVCRYAGKFRCPGKFKLLVRNLDDILADARLKDWRDHNHDPYRISDTNSTANRIIKDEPTDSEAPDESENDVSSTHAISRLDESQFSRDFENLNAGTHSSPQGATPARRTAPDSDADLSDTLSTLSLHHGVLDEQGYEKITYFHGRPSKSKRQPSSDPE